MKSLIYKDIQLLKKSIITLAIYQIAIFSFYIIFRNMYYYNTNNGGFDGFIVGAISGMSLCLGFAMTYSTFNLDEKNKSNIYLNSIPVKRSNMVFGRYISIFIYVLILYVVQLVMTGMIQIFCANVSVDLILKIGLLSFLGGIALICMSAPFFFKFTANKAAFISLLFWFTVGAVLMVIMIFSSVKWASIAKHIKVQYMGLNFVPVCIILFIISAALSLSFYKKREF